MIGATASTWPGILLFVGAVLFLATAMALGETFLEAKREKQRLQAVRASIYAATQELDRARRMARNARQRAGGGP